MKIKSTLLKCIPFFALPGLSLAAINMQELEDFSKNFDTRFIETKRPSLADFGWHVIKEGADSTDNRIVQLKGIFEEIINTPWVYNNRNDIKTIYDRFKSLSFDKLTSVSNVLDHFNKVFTDKFEFNFLKSLLLERKFLDELQTDQKVFNDFIKSQGNQPVDCNKIAFIKNRISDKSAFRISLMYISEIINEGYSVDMIFKDRTNSFSLDRIELKKCVQKAQHSQPIKSVPLTIEPLLWLCSKRKNPNESDFLALSILRNSLLDENLQKTLKTYFYPTQPHYYFCNKSLYELQKMQADLEHTNKSLLQPLDGKFLVDLIIYYRNALENNKDSVKKYIPFYELDFSDSELEPSELEPMDIEEEPEIPAEKEREKPEHTEDNLLKNNSSNAFANNESTNDKNAGKKTRDKTQTT